MNPAFRFQFPALQRTPSNQSIVFLDGPGGTQVPNQVIDAISQYYKRSNANTHGSFLYSKETDQLMDRTREKVATFLGANGPECISYGQNMTSLNYSLAKGMGRYFQKGDEVIITQLDHEANRGPWLSLRSEGVIVKEVVLKQDGTLDYEDLKAKLSNRTRLVAMGLASNILGTVNNVEIVRKLTYEVGAWLLLDAVHYVPHFPVDVVQLDCDFLLCSAYKFYGPHVGLLYSRPGLLDQLPTDRLRTTDQHAPFSIETGTLNHAAIAGVEASIDFIGAQGTGIDLRESLVDAMEKIRKHEYQLLKQLYDGLKQFPGLDILGLPAENPNRTPTLAITIEGQHPTKICDYLAEHQIFAWDGHFYALRAVEVLGLINKGGVTRLGISAYTSEADINRTLHVFSNLF